MTDTQRPDSSTIHHRLPDESPDPRETVWFGRLNPFEKQETKRQVEFRRRHWPELPDGVWAGSANLVHTYPHILPESDKQENLYPATRDRALAYLSANDIALHREFANLRSSQVCCLNFLFPLRTDLEAAVVALRPLLPGVVQVEEIEFEYTGPCGSTCWLGEPSGGKRGQNRTSVDAAIRWHDTEGHSRLTLVEWKYTEKRFGTCGGFASDGNMQKDRCRHRAAGTELPWTCYLSGAQNDRTKRRYWEHLGSAGIDVSRYDDDLCPFSGPFYQLLRLQLLAAYCAQEKEAQKVDVAAVHFQGNTALEEPPKELEGLGSSAIEAWQGLLLRPDDFRVCTAESLAAGVRSSGAFPDLAGYLGQRYGV